MITKVEKQKKIGAFVIQNDKVLGQELSDVDDSLKFEGESLEKSSPKLFELLSMITEPESKVDEPTT
jgi:hypothetical protein